MRVKPTKIVYEKLPADDFLLVKVTEIKTITNKFGNEQRQFTLTVLEPEELEGKKITHWLTPILPTEDSKKGTKYGAFIEAADSSYEKGDEYDDDELIDKKLRVMMSEPKEDEFQKIALVKPAKMTAAEKRALAAKDDEEDEDEEEEEEEEKPRAKKAKPAAGKPKPRIKY